MLSLLDEPAQPEEKAKGKEFKVSGLIYNKGIGGSIRFLFCVLIWSSILFFG
jgi:hypothetical protein